MLIYVKYLVFIHKLRYIVLFNIKFKNCYFEARKRVDDYIQNQGN